MAYDPNANCPIFLKSLDNIFDSDEGLIDFVKQASGYSLTGSTAEQCLFIMIGDAVQMVNPHLST